MTPIAPLIKAFLDETLARQRAVSRHTRDSYALSFQLLFVFPAKRLKVSPSALTLEQLDAGLISAFLEHLEDNRKNAPVTRNVRLAAIKSFFRFLEYRQPAALEHVRRVLAIPFKKTDQRLVPYLLKQHAATAARMHPGLDKKRISPHVLRHTCAMIILQATQDIRKVSLWLGHATLTTTEIYTRGDPTEKLDAMESIVPPHLRHGAFRPSDKLIALLRRSS